MRSGGVASGPGRTADLTRQRRGAWDWCAIECFSRRLVHSVAAFFLPRTLFENLPRISKNWLSASDYSLAVDNISTENTASGGTDTVVDRVLKSPPGARSCVVGHHQDWKNRSSEIPNSKGWS